MTETPNATFDLTRVLHQAAERARLAPSIHNTQPWVFHVRDGMLDLRADRTRRLQVLDPDDPDLIARVRPGSTRPPIGLAALDEEVERRRTNRRPFVNEPVPLALINTLRQAARTERCSLLPLPTPGSRAAVAELEQQATQTEERDPAYRAEISAWTTADRRRTDGVQASSVPYRGPGVHPRDEVPLRDFDSRGMGWLPASDTLDTTTACCSCCARTGTTSLPGCVLARHSNGCGSP